MDFFQFASFVLEFLLVSETNDPPNRLWICMVVGALCFLIVYIFQVAGLYTIAKREGYKNRWMIFIPFFNTVYIGVCAQKNKVYGMNAKYFAIITAVIEFLLSVGYVFFFISAFAMWEYIDWEPAIYYTNGTVAFYQAYSVSEFPATLTWLAWVFTNFNSIVLRLLDLLFIILKLLLLTAFFRTYSARQYVWFSIAGALLPLTGILIYVVRNNKGMNYMDYIRKVRERNYRMYQQQYGNPYNHNPYSGGYNNGYGGQGGSGNRSEGSSSAPDPFDGEYGSSSGSGNSNGRGGSSGSDGGSPFDEFN